MLKRTLVFTNPCRLNLKEGQIRYRSIGLADQIDRSIPLEDVGFVMLENQAITITSGLLQALERNDTAVVLCDSTHHPCAVMQSYSGNTTHSETLRYQIEATLPLKKRIWKEIVIKKIQNQARLLEHYELQDATKLNAYAKTVKSDDSNNREGLAAKIYWQSLFGGISFRRERDGDMPNGFLNYGYAVLRAAASRALIGSGLHCAIGIHHRNRYNAFCLVDDFMEPYRPFVDRIVYDLVQSGENGEELTPELKEMLLSVLSVDVTFENRKRPLMVGLSESSAALARCIRGESVDLCFPSLN
ncbi:MAG: type II CRISPR-associated endonuclease Cas1 [Kiritimatiellia bacterium]